MLNAIAIYNLNDGSRVKYAQVSQSRLFPINDLENLEKNTLPKAREEIRDKTLFFSSDGEYHYFRRLKKDETVMAICSKKRLDREEVNYLFRNIEHIQVRPDIVKTSLQDIIRNPLGYTGRDLQLGRIQAELDEVKEITLKNIEGLIERSERLEDLEVKSDLILLNSKKYKEDAAKLNRCCKIF